MDVLHCNAEVLEWDSVTAGTVFKSTDLDSDLGAKKATGTSLVISNPGTHHADLSSQRDILLALKKIND